MTERSAPTTASELDLLTSVAGLRKAVNEALNDTDQLDPATAQAAVDLVSTAVAFYGALSRTEGGETLSTTIPATTTDAATVAAVLLITQNLSLFEFNVWYSRVAEAAEKQLAKRRDT